MTLIAVMDQIATDIEALTPADRASIRYHQIDGREDPEGVAGDRAFAFGPVTRGELSLESFTSSHTRWEFPLVVRLALTGRSLREVADASYRESHAVARAIEKRTSWPAGVVEVLTRGVDTVINEEDESLDLIFSLEALIARAD